VFAFEHCVLRIAYFAVRQRGKNHQFSLLRNATGSKRWLDRPFRGGPWSCLNYRKPVLRNHHNAIRKYSNANAIDWSYMYCPVCAPLDISQVREHFCSL